MAAALLALGCVFDFAATAPAWISPLFLAAVITGSVFPAQRAWASVRRGALDINALMVIAVIGALAIGEWEEAAMVVFLFAVAQWLESRSVERARAAIRELLDLAPPEARITDGGVERLMPLDHVEPGQRMQVRPGERVALDGIVLDGRSDVNQAPITGESVPVEKAAGDEVFAGTINGHGSLVVSVTRRRDDTTLARIIHLVEEAQARRAPVQLFIDRFAAWYTPAIVTLAVAMAALPVLAGAPAETWIYRALVVLVVACPCALVISTPVSMVSALAGAARNGVLIKGGASLERLAGITTVAFDKTGTLTRGEVNVSAAEGLNGSSPGDVLSLAAAVEQQSEHPIAQAIVAEARARHVAFPRAIGVRALPGLGVEGEVDGAKVMCAAPRYFNGRAPLAPSAVALAERFTFSGLSPVVVARDGAAVGIIGVADQERDGAADAVAALRRDGVARVAMLTGDSTPSARAVGARVGVDEVRSELLPSDKVDAVTTLRRHGGVAMVGDGINDAPALAAADVGIVMGAIGSDAAIETADVALMTDDLSRVSWAIRLSRATMRNVRANVAIALVLKGAFVVAAAAGVATLWMAVLAHTGASVIVLANALRLRRFQ
jgi:Cd2+/Zn2+-exporting ATPase